MAAGRLRPFWCATAVLLRGESDTQRILVCIPYTEDPLDRYKAIKARVSQYIGMGYRLIGSEVVAGAVDASAAVS